MMKRKPQSQFSPGLSRLFAAAVVSPEFCRRLLDNAAEALETGYNGTTFALLPAEKALVLSVKAATLADFASHVVNGHAVPAEQGNRYREFEMVGAHSGGGMPALAAFRAR
jgi:hypothetical protein